MEEVYQMPKLDNALKENDEIKIQVHDSPESVESALWRLPVEELSQGSVGCVDGQGNDIEMSFDEQMKAIKQMGFYGFADSKNKVIHIWASLEASIEDLVAFFAHERGHLIGPNHRDFLKEEQKAELYSICAAFAYREAAKIIRSSPHTPHTT